MKTEIMKIKRYKGVALVWTAMLLLLIILMVGLALDTAKVYHVGWQLQNTADSSALAGARLVRLDQAAARLAAIDIALRNFAYGSPVILTDNPSNDPNGDIVIGSFNRRYKTFTPSVWLTSYWRPAPNSMKVVTRRREGYPGGPVPLTFGPIANVYQSNIQKYTIAMAQGGTGAGLIALNPTGTGLYINGTPTLNVQPDYINTDDAEIQINSTSSSGMVIKGTPDIMATEINLTGDYRATGGYDFDPDLPVNPNMPIIPDPLAWLPEPPPATWGPDLAPSDGNTIQITTGAFEFNPGYYSGGFVMTGGDVSFKPGVYILDGGPSGQGGLVVGGNTNFCAKGVMFYIVGTGKVDLAGTGSIVATPLDQDNTEFCNISYNYPATVNWVYEGVMIFQSRSNLNEAKIVGTNLMDLEGTLYFPKNLVDLSGTGDGFGNQMIADSYEISGTGEIIINYDGRNRAPANRSFIVE